MSFGSHLEMAHLLTYLRNKRRREFTVTDKTQRSLRKTYSFLFVLVIVIIIVVGIMDEYK